MLVDLLIKTPIISYSMLRLINSTDNGGSQVTYFFVAKGLIFLNRIGLNSLFKFV